MSNTVRLQLMAMMFLEFLLWGAWYVTMGVYLGDKGLHFTGSQIGLAYSSTGFAALVSPFFIGMIADRFFSAQKVLGVLHLLGALFLFLLTRCTTFETFFPCLLAHTLCYMPTISLANTIAFGQMKHSDKEFPAIRVSGTIAWILIGVAIALFKVDATTTTPFLIGAVIALITGIYAFSLPNTPPKSAGKAVTVREILGLDAIGMLREKSFAVFMVSSLLICIPLSFYFSFGASYMEGGGVKNITAVMTLGQMSEIFFMLVIPFFFSFLGVKYMLIAGMGAWVLRYLGFAFGNAESMLFLWYIAIALHGICYDFFFVTGQIYVEKRAPKEIQASAQGFLSFVTYGIGMTIGQIAAGRTVQFFTTEGANGKGVTDWFHAWMTPAIFSVFVLLFFFVMFKDRTADKDAAA